MSEANSNVNRPTAVRSKCEETQTSTESSKKSYISNCSRQYSVGEVNTNKVENCTYCNDISSSINRNSFESVNTSSTTHLNEQELAFASEKNTSSESEDWQILDMEQPSPQTSKLSGIEDQSDSNNNAGITLQTSETRPSERKKYIDISPLGAERKHYSPLLVYLCTALYSLLPLASAATTLTLVALLFTRFFIVPILYFSYVVWDRKTCNSGGCRSESFYRAKFWSYLAAYFPINLRYTSNFKLDPNENYILNYAPHGIAAFGAVTAFGTNGLNFSDLFPGITARFMVHETSFKMPIMKEVFGLRGDCSVNSQSIDYILSSKSRTGKAGNLITIVVGGLAEADLSNMRVLKIVVAERKGFVKKALIHGAHIIPCIAFGENSVFEKVDLAPGSPLQRLESMWYSVLKFKHPLYFGRSLFSEKFMGVLPYKKPITVVMGDPIPVERVEMPSQEAIDELHAKYIQQLTAMYETNADLCAKYDRKLELV